MVFGFNKDDKIEAEKKLSHMTAGDGVNELISDFKLQRSVLSATTVLIYCNIYVFLLARA